MKNLILVNLLPYREKIKKQKKKQLIIYSSFFVSIGLAFVLAVNGVIISQKNAQEARNDYISSVNDKLSKEISQISDLKIKIKEAIDKKKVVENLQLNKGDTVKLLDLLSNSALDGLELISIEQKGNTFFIKGTTQSNTKVATFMDLLATSSLLNTPILLEIKEHIKTNMTSTIKNQIPRNEFYLSVSLEEKIDAEDKEQTKEKTTK